MKEEERVHRILQAVLLEERAEALLSILLGVASSRGGVRLLTPPQDLDHVVVAAVHRFVQRRVAPSVTRKPHWSKSSDHL